MEFIILSYAIGFILGYKASEYLEKKIKEKCCIRKQRFIRKT